MTAAANESAGLRKVARTSPFANPGKPFEAGIRFLGVSDMASGIPTQGAVTVPDHAATPDDEASKAFPKAYAAANPQRLPATFAAVAAHDTMGMIAETVRKLNGGTRSSAC
ncbi:hypothetical protein SAMN06265795_103179 [Noviherbaspirillum humi]|uniref:Uncharacterized protein n=1 Tax=Noviherbaspirillum humi TaxID=1688639 RepID=A0A239F4U1_9BURK|nr:hypothetical protein [Noviherbaspirillum humi]SNS51845.1 hypothetical protein SAMN06265795_103179 [Noviherbaspirillum humi]